MDACRNEGGNGISCAHQPPRTESNPSLRNYLTDLHIRLSNYDAVALFHRLADRMQTARVRGKVIATAELHVSHRFFDVPVGTIGQTGRALVHRRSRHQFCRYSVVISIEYERGRRQQPTPPVPGFSPNPQKCHTHTLQMRGTNSCVNPAIMH